MSQMTGPELPRADADALATKRARRKAGVALRRTLTMVLVKYMPWACHLLVLKGDLYIGRNIQLGYRHGGGEVRANCMALVPSSNLHGGRTSQCYRNALQLPGSPIPEQVAFKSSPDFVRLSFHELLRRQLCADSFQVFTQARCWNF